MLIQEIEKVVEKAKSNPRCLEQLKTDKEKTIFVHSTDTEEKCYFLVNNGEIKGPFSGEPEKISVRVEGKEKILLEIFRGERDPDAAYLLGKIKVKGSFFEATKLKNLFGLIQG